MGWEQLNAKRLSSHGFVTRVALLLISATTYLRLTKDVPISYKINYSYTLSLAKDN